MSDYYYYLIRTTWPYLFVLFCVFLFVGFKIVKISAHTLRLGRGLRSVPFYLIRVLFWMGILGLYLLMFIPDNQEWLAEPALFAGTISGIDPVEGERLPVRIRDGSENIEGQSAGELKLYADPGFAAKVKPGDEVELIYLPQKREIVKCVLRATRKN